MGELPCLGHRKSAKVMRRFHYYYSGSALQPRLLASRSSQRIGHGGLARSLTSTQLKLLEPVQRAFHLLLMGARRALADPIPTLHQKFLPRPVGFKVESGNDPIPDQNRAQEISEYSLVLGNVSFEAILVIEEEPESLTLDDQRIEGGQDMNLFLRGIGYGIEDIRTDPVQRFAGAFQLHRD